VTKWNYNKNIKLRRWRYLERKWLVEIRESKDFTQQEVASKVGITRSTYTRYERGSRNPKPKTAAKIAELLSFDAGKFFWYNCDKMTQDKSTHIIQATA
jgi:transcriptional regulator with XRE-family HTH domain